MRIVFEGDQLRSAAYDEEALIGVCEFQSADGVWTITHTEVDPAYGGQGIARKLVMCVAEEADRAGVGLASVCSYAARVLGK